MELIDNSESELNNLQENFPKDADKCCSKMFQLWLKRCGGATWNQLVQALRVPGIEMFELANKIESMLLTGMRISVSIMDSWYALLLNQMTSWKSAF